MSVSPGPLVSIITPTFNRCEFLAETIESVRAQDYQNFEHIVIDDGSTDKTPGLLARYQPSIRAITQENRGEHATVNRGFELAEGEIVAVVNSDDPLIPGAISCAVEFLSRHPEVLVAYPDWRIIDEHSRPVREIRVAEYDPVRLFVQHDCCVGPGAFIRRAAIQAVGGRNEHYRYVSDYDFWLRIARHGTLARIPATLASWRSHSGGASSAGRGGAMAREHVELIREHFGDPTLPKELSRRRREALGWAHYAAAYHSSSFVRRSWHVGRFVAIRPTNLASWWQRMRQEKPNMNRLGLIARRLMRTPKA